MKKDLHNEENTIIYLRKDIKNNNNANNNIINNINEINNKYNEKLNNTALYKIPNFFCS